jgi:hypothetical protein
MGDIFRKTTVRALVTQTPNINSVETGFIGVWDLIFVLYSVINNDLLSNNRLLFQDNLVKIDRT